MPLMLAVGTDQQFSRLCETLGLPELATDTRFVTNRKRMEHKSALIPMLAARFKTRSARAWMEALNAVGVASGPINDLGQVLADPQVQHREMLREIPHPLSGTLRIVANPVRFSDTPIEYGRWPPLLGEHTRSFVEPKSALFAFRNLSLTADGALVNRPAFRRSWSRWNGAKLNEEYRP